MAGREQRARKHKQKWILKFAVIVVAIVAIFLIVAIPLASSFYDNETGEFSFNLQKNDPPKKSNETEEEYPNTTDEETVEKNESLKLNVVIFGVDKNEALTDVIIVAMYDSETNKTNLIWVPRDTRVSIPNERRQVLLNEGRKPPSVLKINEVHSYAGKKYANEYSTLQVEELLGIDIDNYAVVNLEAFRYIVKTLGGVYYDVPMDMYYVDPAQDLYIDLKAGYQLLDGDKAEQFVRFREDYPSKDLGRIKAQQDFIKKLFGQALTKESILSNLLEYAYAFISYVKTDFNIADVSKYVKFLGDLNIDDMTTYTIPGEPKTINGSSFFIHDEQGTKDLVASILAAPPASKSEDSQGSVSSKSSTIKVLNGGTVNGLAQRRSTMLKELGYTNISTGNFNGAKTSNTRIIVGEKGEGQDLLKFFSESEIIVDKSQLDGDTDIIIILGTSES